MSAFFPNISVLFPPSQNTSGPSVFCVLCVLCEHWTPNLLWWLWPKKNIDLVLWQILFYIVWSIPPSNCPTIVFPWHKLKLAVNKRQEFVPLCVFNWTAAAGDSYGPSPVSGGAPSPPTRMEDPRRAPSAPLGDRRIDRYGESQPKSGIQYLFIISFG